MATTRVLVRLPAIARAGEIIDVRVLLQHPMETGYRPGADGQTLARNIVTRIEARFEGTLVFAADCFPAIAANPYISFALRAVASGTLTLNFTGDNGWAHSESARLTVA